MGPLMLPAGGPVYIDANAIIYSVERVEPYGRLLAPMCVGSPDQTPARR